jgi:NAD(P)-dependent dehydrogenase (short-subunit alcohol dehydrogenase family)
MQVAIVSGAASGIGLVSAQTFARHGACVVALDIHADNLTRAKASIKGPCLALVCRVESRMRG